MSGMSTTVPPGPPGRARHWRRFGRPILAGLALLGAAAGVSMLLWHLQVDPLVDVRAYYDAGARLNAGMPLYDQPAGIDDPDFYRYPPLLAIVFRPVAALVPYEVAAIGWGVLSVAVFVATIRVLGVRRFEVWVAIGLLGLPIGWALAIGQAQVQVTWLMALGSPWAIAVAANLKLMPAVAAVWWLGRRDRRRLGQFAAWMAGLVAFQFVVEPQATLDFIAFTSLEQVGEVRNLSPYRISPLLWGVLVVAGGLMALRLAPTRWGWAAAVALSVLATPRLLAYMFMTLLAGLRRTEAEAAQPQEPTPPSTP
jgi:hypothetical protein